MSVIKDALDAMREVSPDQNERKYGTLTPLKSAQAKIMPAAFGFHPDDTIWGPDQAKYVVQLAVNYVHGRPGRRADFAS